MWGGRKGLNETKINEEGGPRKDQKRTGGDAEKSQEMCKIGASIAHVNISGCGGGIQTKVPHGAVGDNLGMENRASAEESEKPGGGGAGLKLAWK